MKRMRKCNDEVYQLAKDQALVKKLKNKRFGPFCFAFRIYIYIRLKIKPDVKIHNQPVLRMRRKQNRGPVLRDCHPLRTLKNPV